MEGEGEPLGIGLTATWALVVDIGNQESSLSELPDKVYTKTLQEIGCSL